MARKSTTAIQGGLAFHEIWEYKRQNLLEWGVCEVSMV
jgi:hypothetical protein